MAVSWVFCAEQDHALMATETACLRNPHDHRPGDTLATLDIPFLSAVCEGLHQALDAS
jgi:hypothetical protein